MTLKEIGRNQFLQALAIVAAVWLAWQLRLVLITVFIAFVLTTSLYPLVQYLKRRGLPTFLAVALPPVVFFAALGALLYLLLPPFIDHLVAFAENTPDYVTSISHQLGISVHSDNVAQTFAGKLSGFSGAAISITGRALEALAAAVAVVVLTIYWLGSYDSVRQSILELFRGKSRRRLNDIWDRVELKMRSWLRAHIILNTVVGLLVWLALTILNIPFAGLLAFIAFLVEIIPTLGPIIAGAPAVLIGLSISGTKGLLVLGAYVIIQQMENHIFSPLLLGKTVRLHPIIIIISLLIGAKLLGIIGALIAVPLTLCLSAVADSYRAGQPKASR
ncbi:MAG TPA: AI-2E family transporter [Candidatus Saccharimonadales bacterium]|nr:AI-2E family transporter [Candidatus Saccharimonadales bacterium]